VEIRMVRNTIARRALEASPVQIKPLADFIEDQTALIFSDLNPFKLNSIWRRASSPCPSKLAPVPPRIL